MLVNVRKERAVDIPGEIALMRFTCGRWGSGLDMGGRERCVGDYTRMEVRHQGAE